MKGLSAVVVAAGASQRFREKIQDKAFVSKALFDFRGQAIIRWTLQNLFETAPIEKLALVVSEGGLDAFRSMLSNFPHHNRVELVLGGRRRQDSVRCGLESLKESRHVLVHDGARPIFRKPYMDQLLMRLAESVAVIPVSQIVETVVETSPTSEISKSVDRERLRRVQTPQAFDFGELRRLHLEYRSSEETFTDDASLFLKAGIPVQTTDGDPLNIKITQYEDLKLLEAFFDVAAA